MSFKDRLKEARLSKNLKQIELSEKIGLSKNAVSNYEAGSSFPNVETLYKIFDVLETSPNFLFQDDVPVQEISLTADEKKLVLDYRQLNKINQQKVNNYIQDLLQIPKYRKETDAEPQFEKEQNYKMVAWGGDNKESEAPKEPIIT